MDRSVAEQEDLTPEELIRAIEESLKDFKDGDLVEGTVVKVDRDEVLLDIGYKSEGVIPVKELSIRQDVDPAEVVKVGDHIEALVLQKEDKEGRLILSKKRAQYERAWKRIEDIMKGGGTITGPVIEVVKGGLILDIGLRGFLPASLVELRRVRDLHPYVGQALECKIIELDRNRNNVVLSRRAFLEESQSEGRKKFLESLTKGERRKGTVSSIVNFGAFVDLGGVDGLVHVSELSWKPVDHPSEVVNVGDQVQVKVIDVDVSRRRISLSMRQVGEQTPAPPEIEAEPIPAASTQELAEEVVPEVSAETREVLADAATRADEGTPEALSAVVEPEPAAPEEVAMREEPEPEEPEPEEPEPEVAAEPGAAAEGQGEEEVSLEAILRDLKRREGRPE